MFEANKLYQALQNYNVNVLLFPMDDFLTSEALAISPELKITRLETLNEFNKVDKTSNYKKFQPITFANDGSMLSN